MGEERYQSSGTVPNRRTQGQDRQILSRFSEYIYQGQKLTGPMAPRFWSGLLNLYFTYNYLPTLPENRNLAY
jgi:hypothetical protein